MNYSVLNGNAIYSFSVPDCLEYLFDRVIRKLNSSVPFPNRCPPKLARMSNIVRSTRPFQVVFTGIRFIKILMIYFRFIRRWWAVKSLTHKPMHQYRLGSAVLIEGQYKIALAVDSGFQYRARRSPFTRSYSSDSAQVGYLVKALKVRRCPPDFRGFCHIELQDRS